jgi:hypothetical protein
MYAVVRGGVKRQPLFNPFELNDAVRQPSRPRRHRGRRAGVASGFDVVGRPGHRIAAVS